MAKQTQFQQNHGGRSRSEQRDLETKRAANHSPAIERKRAENAWHTNPLAPIPAKVLRNQAASLMRTLYKPGFEQLSNEEKRVNSISEKRKADNSYYLNWLTKQSELLGAHDEAARQQVLAAGQQAQSEVAKGWEDLHSQLMQGASQEAGTVSNPEENAATATALLAGANKSSGDISEQRNSTADQLGTLQTGAALGSAENFAQIAAQEAKRKSDQNEALTGVRNSRTQLRGERAGEAAKFYQQSLDKEIEKAQARASIAASEATAAIEAKRFGLDVSKAKREGEEFNFERQNKNRKFGLETKEQEWKELTGKQKQQIEEGKLTVAEAEEQNKRKHLEHEGQRTPAEKAKSHEKQRAKNQQINANIETTVQTLHQSPKLRQLVTTNPAKVKEILHNKYGYNPLAIQVAVELYLGHEISQSTRRALESVGYNGKYV